MLHEVFLNEHGITYIENELSQGAELSQCLLRLNHRQGNAFTYMPENMQIQSIADLSESMEFLSGVNVTADFRVIAVKFISGYLATGSSHIALFETLWDGGDPVLKQREYPLLLMSSTAYLFIRSSDEIMPVREYLQLASGYPTVVALFENGSNESFLPGMELDEAVLDKLSKNLDFLVIGAFDGEGYVFWSKDQIPG